MNRATLTYLLACGVAAVAYFLVPEGAAETLFVVVAASSAFAIVVGIRRHRPDPTWPWWAVAGGLGLWAVGEAIWCALFIATGDVPDLSVADGAYLAGYLALAAGLNGMVRARRPGRDTEGLVDALVLGVALLAMGWVYLVAPLAEEGAPGVVDLVALAYPLGDIVLLAVGGRLLLSDGRRRAAFWLLVGGLLLTLAADTAYVAVITAEIEYPLWLDAAWIGGYAAMGAAALSGSMADLTRRGGRTSAALTPARLALLGLAMLAVPTMQLLRPADGFSWLLAPVEGVLALLVLLRVGLLVTDRDRELRARVEAQQQLAHEATHDALTGLIDRAEFGRRLDDRLTDEVTHRRVAVLFCDLDGFKVVNDSLGHPYGDRLLVAVARRLESALGGDVPTQGATPVLARFGGDEFVLFCDVRDRHDALAVANRINALVREPIEVDGQALTVGCSIGVAVAAPGEDAADLIRDADAAMYRSKAAADVAPVLFDQGMRAAAVSRHQTEIALRAALQAEDEIGVVWQPLVDLDTGAVVAAEALVRWDRPDQGVLPPSAFVPLAEETGLIGPLGERVLQLAVAQAARWQQAFGAAAPRVGVNVAMRELTDDLPTRVAAVCEASGVSPSALTIEVTETAVADSDRVVRVLRRLSRLGVRIALDDFGTGYSSLRQLRDLPVDVVKVDRGFVAGLDTSPDDAAVTSLIVGLGHIIGCRVVAEGVETPAQLAALRTLGCDLAQGFLLAHPGPADEVDRLLAAGGIALLGAGVTGA